MINSLVPIAAFQTKEISANFNKMKILLIVVIIIGEIMSHNEEAISNYRATSDSVDLSSKNLSYSGNLNSDNNVSKKKTLTYTPAIIIKEDSTEGTTEINVTTEELTTTEGPFESKCCRYIDTLIVT